MFFHAWAYKSDSRLPDGRHKEKPRVVVTTHIANEDNGATACLIPQELFRRLGERRTQVQPNLKKSDGSDPANYRLIAVTSILCKVLERIINKQLVLYLEDQTDPRVIY